MRQWQKISATLFLSAMLVVNSAQVSAGDGYAAEDSQDILDDDSQGDDEIFEESSDEFEETISDELPPLELPRPTSNGKNKTSDEDDENLNPPEDEEDFLPPEDEDEIPDTGIIGDVNGDGELNAVDLVILQKYLKDEIFYISETAADIDGDGTISAFDLHALLNLIKAERKGTGDVNGDGKIDIYDVQTFTAYLANPSTPINSGNADLNGDGKISVEDLKILRKVISALTD